jgi:hypothetical protein
MLAPPFEEGALNDRLALALPGETVPMMGIPGNVAVVVPSLPPPPPQASKLEEISSQRPYWTKFCGRN